MKEQEAQKLVALFYAILALAITFAVMYLLVFIVKIVLFALINIATF